MAEKYGTVPPRFTKKWWEYFWYYYKWRVIITAAAVLLAAVTIVQCATRPKYDLYAVYCGHMNFSEANIEAFRSLIAERIDDIDQNGEKSVLFSQLVFSDTTGSADYDYAVQTKLDLTMGDDRSFIYLFDKAEAELQLQKEAAGEIFTAAEEFNENPAAETLAAADGRAYAVSLSGSAILKENGISGDDLYLVIRQNYNTDAENITAYKNTLEIARLLTKN